MAWRAVRYISLYRGSSWWREVLSLYVCCFLFGWFFKKKIVIHMNFRAGGHILPSSGCLFWTMFRWFVALIFTWESVYKLSLSKLKEKIRMSWGLDSKLKGRHVCHLCFVPKLWTSLGHCWHFCKSHLLFLSISNNSAIHLDNQFMVQLSKRVYCGLIWCYCFVYYHLNRYLWPSVIPIT